MAIVQAAHADPAQIARRNLGDGVVLTESRGMTLYRFDMDKEPGKSACVDACAKAWPPLAAPSNAEPNGPWSLITRADGSQQWAYGGKPLYTYVGDPRQGDANGDGLFFNLWHMEFLPMATPPGITVHATLIGHVLADASGMTLYTFDQDSPGKSACVDTCAEDRMPVPAPAIAGQSGDWSAVRRPDGVTQWAWRGRPLYRHAGDFKPGETNGNHGPWHAAIVRAPPVIPAGLHYQATDLGRVVADASGRTLYTMSDSPDRPKVCDDACIQADWRPAAGPSSQPQEPGWTTMKQHDGSFQWAYKGKPVYTFRMDEKPGDIRGDRFGNMASGGFAPWDPVQPEL